MKKDKILTTILFIVVILLINGSCKKENDTELKDEEISTEISIPVLSTNEVSAISKTTVTSGGNITSDGGATISERGVCWSTNQTPTITDSKTSDGTGVGSFESSITGLTSNTTYYIRAYATNSKGTGYGVAKTFKTLDEGSVNTGNILFNPDITYSTMTDIDGNTYKTVNIGTQTWMAENLKVTKYNDGVSIPNVTDDVEWSSLTNGAYCNYNSDSSNVSTYGRLYNWYAVSTNKLCSKGWHVPTDLEWTTLTDYLGGDTIAGGKLKELGTLHWISQSGGANNETGFTALPAGSRNGIGIFNFNGRAGDWWTSTPGSTGGAYRRDMPYEYNSIYRSLIKENLGFSVRCIKD